MKSSLSGLRSAPVLIDANILMMGIKKRSSDPNYSFERMKTIVFEPLLKFCSDIYVHEKVYNELDKDSKALIDLYVGKGVVIVSEGSLYGQDPQYTDLWNRIAGHELFNYERGERKNAGEVYSLAFALHNHLPFFCSSDGLVDIIVEELNLHIEIITFDVILLIASIFHKDNAEYKKAIKSMYKLLCADVIRRRELPQTFGEYVIWADKQGWLK